MNANQRQSLCVIAEAFGFGGTEVHTLSLIGALVKRGYKVELVSARKHVYDDRVAAQGWGDRVTITHGQYSVSDSDEAAIQYWKQLFVESAASVLILPKGDYRVGSIPFLQLCKHSFRRIFFIEHLEADPIPRLPSRRLFGVIPIGFGLWWRRLRVERIKSAKFANKIIAVSQSVKDRLTNDWGIPRRKIVVVHNGVNWAECRRDPAAGAAFRAEHGIPSDAFIFGMLTRLSYFKAIDIALQAMALLVQAEEKPPFRLVLAGDGEEAEKLKELSRQLNISQFVSFLGHTTNIRAALSSFDVIMFSSRREGLPLALLEGMAAECVPIVTAVSGMPEAVNSLAIGRVVPVENPQALKQAMADILSFDRGQLTAMRKANLDRVRKHFDLTDSHSRLIEEFGL